jgi:hypothetical protein
MKAEYSSLSSRVFTAHFSKTRFKLIRSRLRLMSCWLTTKI